MDQVQDNVTIKRIENDYDKEIVLVSDYENFDIKKVPLYDALILDYTERDKCLKALRDVRGSGIESIYLIPLFVLSIADIKNQEIVELADGVINNIQTDTINTFVENVKSKRRQLKPFNMNAEINKNLIKMLRFSFSRDKELKPVKDRHHIIGFKYPILSLSLGDDNARMQIQTVHEAVEKEFFKAEYVDRLHLCSNCSSGFLNYKELDPETNSSHLETENLIHHFTCAYIGPESDFIRGDQYTCPKCNKTLRHIGVDYDKPSVMYHVVGSDRYFQEPVMKAECMNCGHQNEVEGLQQYDVYNLTLTEEGKEEAIQPKGSQSVQDVVYSGFITYSTFGTFLRYEIERVKTSSRNSSIGLIRLNITSKMEAELGTRYVKIIEEISSFISNNTDSSCILSRSMHSFFILFPDTPLEKCQMKIEKIKLAVIELLKNNVKDQNINVHSTVREITPTSEYQTVLNDLRASILND